MTGWLVSLVGFVATVLTQSSSAAIAVILTAAAGGVIGLEAAAAALIGANLGTTSTAALALLPLMLALVARLADWLDVEGSPAAMLALFHTVFNVLGVMLMLPLADRLATLLERLFRSEADELARPQHLDATLAATPALAAAALHEELGRLRGIVSTLAHAALTGPAPVLQRQYDAVRTLVEAIQRFVSSVRAEGTAEDVGAELAGALAAARYLQEAAALAPNGAALRSSTASLDDVAIRAALERLQSHYRETKEALLVAAVARRLSVEDTDSLLDDLRATRRRVDQLLEADWLLSGPKWAAEIEAGVGTAGSG